MTYRLVLLIVLSAFVAGLCHLADCCDGLRDLPGEATHSCRSSALFAIVPASATRGSSFGCTSA